MTASAAHAALMGLPLHPFPVGRDGASPAADGFTPLRTWLRPPVLRAAVEAVGARYGTADPVVAASLTAKEVLAAATHVAVAAWVHRRRVPDLTPANVAVGDGGGELGLALLRPRMYVLPGDELEGSAGTRVVPNGSALFRRLCQGWLDSFVPAVVAGVRSVVRVGSRHLWGTVAVSLVNDLAGEHGPGVADDRARLLGARPELAATVEVVTVDGAEGTAPVVFAIRRTCCRLVDSGCGLQCSTCSLLDRQARIDDLSAWYRAFASGSKHA